MPALEPTPEQRAAFATDPHNGPIVMVNLLKFRDVADYPADAPEHGQGLSGQAAYARYGAEVAKLGADPEIGIETVFMAPAMRTVIGDVEWDAVALARYPSRAHMARMLADPRYQAAYRHRIAGLLHQDLIETRV